MTPRDTRDEELRQAFEAGRDYQQALYGGTSREVAAIEAQFDALLRSLETQPCTLEDTCQCAKCAREMRFEPRERALCSTCHGNGVVKIPGGVSVCDACDGNCWAKPETQDGRPSRDFLLAENARLKAALKERGETQERGWQVYAGNQVSTHDGWNQPIFTSEGKPDPEAARKIVESHNASLPSPPAQTEDSK